MNVSLFCVLFVDLTAAASAPHDVFQAAKAFHVSNAVIAVRCEVTIHCKGHSFPDYFHGIDLFVSQLFCILIMTVRIFVLEVILTIFCCKVAEGLKARFDTTYQNFEVFQSALPLPDGLPNLNGGLPPPADGFSWHPIPKSSILRLQLLRSLPSESAIP